jgi:hypothetical protein
MEEKTEISFRFISANNTVSQTHIIFPCVQPTVSYPPIRSFFYLYTPIIDIFSKHKKRKFQKNEGLESFEMNRLDI